MVHFIFQYFGPLIVLAYYSNSFTKCCHGYFICNLDNKRLDEWVSMDRMDFDHVQLPKKEVKVASLRSSRPASPADVATCDSGSNTPPWPTCNLKRHLSGAAATAAVNKKRKLEQAVMAAAVMAANTNNTPSTSAVTATTPTSTNAIMVIILVTIVTEPYAI